MSILDKLKDIQIDDSLSEQLKKDNYIIKDEEILDNNAFLTYTPPKKLFLLKEDSSLLNLIFTVYYSYAEITLATGEIKIKKGKTRVLKSVFNGELDEYKTENVSVKNKILYELAQIEKKSKGKKRIKVDGKGIVHVQYLNRSFNSYEIHFQKKDGTKEIKKVKAATEEQVNLLSNYLIKKYSDKYYKIDYIYRSDFGKTFWEAMFFAPQKRKQFSTSDLLEYTRKLYKIHKSDPNLSTVAGIEKLVYTSEGNVRATVIALSSIVKSTSINKINSLLMILNEEDRKLGFKETFDPIYLAVIGLADKEGGSIAKSYLNLVNIIERKLFLETALKKALKGPLFVLAFLIAMGGVTVKGFSKILFDIYEGIGEPRPPVTDGMVKVIDFFIKSSYPQDLFNRIFGTEGFLHSLFSFFTLNIILIILVTYLFIASFNYFSKFSFYGKKFMHNFSLTIPLFGNFLKRSDFEIFLTIGDNLYGAGSATHTVALPLLKDVVKNYHIQGIINTSYNNFVTTKVSPGKFFVLFPDYFPDKVAVLFGGELPDPTEMNALANTYRNDNDEFIQNLKAIISNGLLFVAGGLLMVIVFATIVPMFGLATKI